MMRLWLIQVLAVMRLEMKKTFFTKRGLWIYVLAFAPALLYMIHSIYAGKERRAMAELAMKQPVSSRALNAIQKGISLDEVRARLGEPYWQESGQRQKQYGKKFYRTRYKYTDGQTDVTLWFRDNELTGIERREYGNLDKSQLIFATSFHFYFLRLAVFFGCVGIFVNLFRGEMLEKSLHFYLLTPMRREVLLAGKYLAGLVATVVIFTFSTTLQWWAMLSQFNGNIILEFLNDTGWHQFAGYTWVTALACVGYGSIFLAVGLLFRNPIIPTAIVLVWESANPFLPAVLKKTSLLYYLQSLCPVSAATTDPTLPPPIRLLISPTEPASPVGAVFGILILTGLVLVVTARLARRLEINYSTD